ncbi:MAG: peptidoglycan D,D-transpeptidase FtsI family protein [Armatimonadota bacterium]
MSAESAYNITVTRRVRWAFALIVFGFLIIFSRTVQLTVVDRARTLALRGLVDGEPLAPPPPPGDILDRHGQLLATSAQYISVCANPSRVARDKQRLVARVVAAQLDMDENEILRKLRRGGEYAVIRRGVTPDAANAVDALGLRGVFLERSHRRVYPMGQVACQVLGFREKSITQRPLAGVELSQRHILDSRSGGPTDSPYADLTPVALTSIGLRSARPGNALVLTIDARLQAEVEALLNDALNHWAAKSVTATVMDARTGELLCVATVPQFDPNHFERVPESEQTRFALLPASRAWEPGSVCKVVVVAAGLESGIISPDSHYTCRGTRRVGGWEIGCWGRYRYVGHGTLTPLETLVHSCNMCASQISEQIGARLLSEWLREFGFGASTHSGLPAEANGVIPAADHIKPARLATMGYGQGFQVTDLQVVQFMGAVANGGNLVPPRVVRRIESATSREPPVARVPLSRRVLSPEIAEMLLTMMEEVVKRGTGKQADVPGVRVAGKTGTAEKVRAVNGRAKYADDLYISSFAGVLGAGGPRPVVIMVSLDEPKDPATGRGATGGQCAAPLFRRVGEVVLRNLDRYPTSPTVRGESV